MRTALQHHFKKLRERHEINESGGRALSAGDRLRAHLWPQYAAQRTEGYTAPEGTTNPFQEGTVEHEAWRYGNWLKRQEHQ